MAKCCSLKGEVSGGASLSARLTSAQRLSAEISVGLLGVKSTYQFGTRYDFPTVGEKDALYIAADENAAYRWNEGDLHYYCIGRDYNEIKLINGGDANGE